MKCQNFFCVYQKQGECILDEITLDIDGRCEDCIYVNINDDLLQKLKVKQLTPTN